MKITIRPAPHSKSCAWAGKEWCSKFDNQPLRCETECPEGWCCEMKHCWEVGEKLRDILLARGHEVKMGDKQYRKAPTESKANSNRKADMANLLAWEPDVHIALHTNSADSAVRGVRFGYPDIKNNSGEQTRVNRSLRLAQIMTDKCQVIYPLPDKVKPCTYNFYELNVPKCPALYIEGCFANSNKADAEWWHNNMDEIATMYADAIEAWRKEEEEPFMNYKAYVKTKLGGGASVWSDNRKSKRVVLVKDGCIVTVTGKADSKGFVPVEYAGMKGVFDSQYLVRIEEEVVELPEKEDTLSALREKLQAIRDAVDEAISMIGT